MSQEILSSLYPFAQSSKSASEKQEVSVPNASGTHPTQGLEDAVLATSIEQKVAESIEVKQMYFKAQQARIIAAAKLIAQTYLQGGKMLTMGNGGSNCDASHLALEFLHPVTAGRSALPALNLGADPAVVTAVSNDLGFDNAYIRQLIAYAQPGDILVGFSTSGCSNNLMSAFEKAKSLGVSTLGLAGMKGGDMAKSPALDVCLVVESMSVHRIQESHLTTYHILWDLVHSLLAEQRKGQVK